MEKGVLWMARDRDGSLFLYRRKPRKDDGSVWYVESGAGSDAPGCEWYELPPWLCPEVSWDEDEPRLVDGITVTFIGGARKEVVP